MWTILIVVVLGVIIIALDIMGAKYILKTINVHTETIKNINEAIKHHTNTLNAHLNIITIHTRALEAHTDSITTLEAGMDPVAIEDEETEKGSEAEDKIG
ncbi:hypothetical protein LCGC14_1739980 [marine sediment metagenome]|uniref:Uncharacterized protein n=1 Tax=marine sediment metagenome TaxID=412755 RepID=A0A0F9K6P7_9ZZZZ